MMEPWIGVDLDGTLAITGQGSWRHTIGRPIQAMVERVKFWRGMGIEVRVMTARVCDDPTGSVKRNIERWCSEVLGEVLPVTNVKDYGMLCLYDDRCVQVESNTGIILGDDTYGPKLRAW